MDDRHRGKLQLVGVRADTCYDWKKSRVLGHKLLYAALMERMLAMQLGFDEN